MAIFNEARTEDILTRRNKINKLKEETDKIMIEFMDSIKKDLKRNIKITNVKNIYDRYYIDIHFLIIYDDKERSKFIKNGITPILNSKCNEFGKKYNTTFYWNYKVMIDDSVLVEVDTDYYYDNKNSFNYS